MVWRYGAPLSVSRQKSSFLKRSRFSINDPANADLKYLRPRMRHSFFLGSMKYSEAGAEWLIVVAQERRAAAYLDLRVALFTMCRENFGGTLCRLAAWSSFVIIRNQIFDQIYVRKRVLSFASSCEGMLHAVPAGVSENKTPLSHINSDQYLVSNNDEGRPCRQSA